MDKDYIEITALNAINDIEFRIKKELGNSIFDDTDKLTITREKMLPLLVNIYTSTIQKDKEFIALLLNNNNITDLQNKLKQNFLYNYKCEMENISSIQLFYAYYNDNFDLLKTLLREGIRINETGGKIDGLFLLNKKLSSIFEIKQYIELIKKDFNLLRCISCYHREEVYAELIKINPGFKCYIEQEKFFNRILSYPQYKEIFGYEFIANSNENQQHMLYTAESGGYIGCGKLKVLLDLNLNFYLGARDVISQKFLLNFGLERVAFLPLHQQSAFVYAFENNVVSTLEKILAINSEFKLDIGYSNKSVLIYPKIITLCGIQNIAFTTQEQQEELCDSYHKYFHYNSDYDKTHKIARYGQFKDTVNKVKTLTKNNSKLLDDKVGE